MSSLKLTPEVVAQCDAIHETDSKIMGNKTKWNKIRAIIEAHGIGEYIDNVDIDEVTVHLVNKSGLGLNPTNAHSNGLMIKRGGTDRNELRGSTCMRIFNNSTKLLNSSSSPMI